MQKKKMNVKKPAQKKATKKKSEEKKGLDDATVKTRSIKTPSLLRGMKDILPKDSPFWYRIWDVTRGIAQAYGYDYIETPILEEASLFVRSIGRGTDVVDKEMYVFEDRDGSKVAMRPEGTAALVRSYIGHGMYSHPQPVKVWHMGPMFRHDRPQAGRYRQFHQFDCDVIGERDPVIDAELVVMAYNVLNDLGLSTNVYINSIGTVEDRERYQIELVGYLRSKRSYLSDESKKRINRNPMRVLDSKDEQDQPIIEEAPQILDWLGDDSKEYFMSVLEYLDELDIPYMLKPTLVRGLDYYSDTVFELFQEGVEQGSQSALGGGGRYDRLVEQIGGRPTPACGFALGLERIVSAMRRQSDESEQTTPTGPSIYFAQLGQQARRRALGIIEDLRRSGIILRHNIAKASLKSQLELANKYGTTHALILGQKEMQDGTIIVRDMDSGNQEIIDQKKIKIELEKLMEK
jgi:histidyl-tRNA synthetase